MCDYVWMRVFLLRAASLFVTVDVYVEDGLRPLANWQHLGQRLYQH
jgi:hypothetical protein